MKDKKYLEGEHIEYIDFRSDYLKIEFNEQWKAAIEVLLTDNTWIFTGGLNPIGRIIVEYAREPDAPLPAVGRELLHFLIKTPTGRTITIPCGRLDPIGMMRSFIQEKTQTPVRALIFAGKKLEDERTFEDYNISQGHELGVSVVYKLGSEIEKTTQHSPQASSSFFPPAISPQQIIGGQVVTFVEAMDAFLKTQQQVVWDKNAASSFIASALSGMIKSPLAFTEGLTDPYRYPPVVATFIGMYDASNPSLQKGIHENPDFAVHLKNRLAKGEIMGLKEEFPIASPVVSPEKIANESRCSLM